MLNLNTYCTHSYHELPNVNLFDFDGVLAYPLEEGLFQLPLGPHDVEFVSKMAYRHDLNLSRESFKSSRYICIQAALYDAGIPIKRGPAFQHILEGPYHIITARSDRFAVARVQEFIENNMHSHERPIKVMHVDHLPKGQMIQMLLDTHQDNRYSFYDDREKHVVSARSLKNPRLDVYHIDNDMTDVYVEASKFYNETILELAL